MRSGCRADHQLAEPYEAGAPYHAPQARTAPRRFLAAVLSLAGALPVFAAAPNPAVAGDILGRIEGMSPAVDVARLGAYLTPRPNGVIPTLPLQIPYEQAYVIALTQDAGASSTKTRASCPVVLQHGGLRYAVGVARAGGKGSLRNDDSVAYAFASPDSDLATLNEPLAGGTTLELSAGGGQHIDIRGTEHGHLISRLYFLEGLVACSPVDRRGDFALRSLAAGTYQVHLLGIEGVVATREVTVTKVGEVTLGAFDITPTSAEVPSQ